MLEANMPKAIGYTTSFGSVSCAFLLELLKSTVYIGQNSYRRITKTYCVVMVFERLTHVMGPVRLTHKHVLYAVHKCVLQYPFVC